MMPLAALDLHGGAGGADFPQDHDRKGDRRHTLDYADADGQTGDVVVDGAASLESTAAFSFSWYQRNFHAIEFRAVGPDDRI